MSADPERWRKAERRDRWAVLRRGLAALVLAIAVGFAVNGYLESSATQGQLLGLTQKVHAQTQKIQSLGQGNQALLDQLRAAVAARNADEAQIAVAVNQIEAALAEIGARVGTPATFTPLPVASTTTTTVPAARPGATPPRRGRRR